MSEVLEPVDVQWNKDQTAAAYKKQPPHILNKLWSIDFKPNYANTCQKESKQGKWRLGVKPEDQYMYPLKQS